MRAIWNGAIGFGLVNIPVRLYSATEESSLDLDMLDKKDHAHIRFRRVNERTGKEVKWDNIVKAYEYEGEYVVLEDADFEKAIPEKTKLLSIDQFVDSSEIDSVFFEAPYFLEPQKNGERAYELLLQALIKTQMVAVGTFVLRTREMLVCLRPYQDKVLLLQKMRFVEELRDYADLNIPGSTVKAGELKMAVSLIRQLAGPYNAQQYTDTYTAALMKIIKAKAKGKPVTGKRVRVTTTRTVDLLEQLKASLQPKRKSKQAS